MSAFVLDTGALIAAEHRRLRMKRLLELARAETIALVVPGVCIAEWWRGRTDVRERILSASIVDHGDDALMKLAGEAQARVRASTAIDAIVMATAARRGGMVLTSDVDDMQRLQTAFPDVRVLGV